MKHAGHKNPNTYNNHYQPNNSGTDGQGSYFGSEVRTIVNDLFRGTTVARNPDLPQRLPAEKEEALAHSPEHVAIRTELAALRGQQGDTAAKRRTKLYQDRKKLADKELSRWQQSLPCRRPKTGTESMAPPCYERAIFSRVKFLMPERDRLASILLDEPDTLRSPTGLEALRSMVALCEADAEVVVRPGLEPNKCCCEDSARRQKPPSSAGSSIKRDAYDWKHVHRCFKNAHSDSEFCFLCSDWIYDEKEWTEHCSQHLASPDELPVQCDPLMYGGVLATAGYCMFCMADLSLPPTERLCQFLDKRTWQQHVHGHYNEFVQAVGDGKLIVCPHPGTHCNLAFDSVDQFRFHVLDWHCRDLIKAPSKWDAPSLADNVDSPRSSKKARKAGPDARGGVGDTIYCFVDLTAEMKDPYGSEEASMEPNSEDATSSYPSLADRLPYIKTCIEVRETNWKEHDPLSTNGHFTFNRSITLCKHSILVPTRSVVTRRLRVLRRRITCRPFLNSFPANYCVYRPPHAFWDRWGRVLLSSCGHFAPLQGEINFVFPSLDPPPHPPVDCDWSYHSRDGETLVRRLAFEAFTAVTSLFRGLSHKHMYHGFCGASRSVPPQITFIALVEV